MALSDQTLSQIAFKNLQGKSHTDNTKGLGNEAEGIFLNIGSDSVFMDSINSDPAQAIIDGVAEYITADLTLDPTSNGGAYFATYPTGHSKQGQRVVSSISPSYGYLYEAKPFLSGSVPIPVNDPRDWIFQYNSGIFYQQDVVGSVPVNIDIYVYIGTLLSQLEITTDVTNGLSETSQGTIGLGGTLDRNTSIYLDEYGINIKRQEIISSNLSTDTTFSPEYTEFRFIDSIGIIKRKEFRIDASPLTFRDDVNLTGIQYYADYSPNFVDNSLITKKFLYNIIQPLQYIQISHGFSVGDLVCVSGTSWIKAISDIDAETNDSFVTNIIKSVIDSDTFIIGPIGTVLDIDLGYSDPKTLYLSQTIDGESDINAGTSGYVQYIGWYFNEKLFFNPQEPINIDNIGTGGGSSDLELGETDITAYRGDRGKIAYDHSQLTHDKSLVGLSNVVNLDTSTTANITDSINKRFVTDSQQIVLTNTSGINTGDNATNTQYSGLASSKEDVANKSTSTSDSASSIKFPVWSVIVSYFDLNRIKTILGITTLSGSNTGDETTGSIQTKRPIKTIDSISLEGIGNIIVSKVRTSITHSVSGVLTIDLNTADIFDIDMNNTITEFRYINGVLNKEYIFNFFRISSSNYQITAFQAGKFRFQGGNLPVLTNMTGLLLVTSLDIYHGILDNKSGSNTLSFSESSDWRIN